MRTASVRSLPVPPHSIEAEECVLGSLLLDPKAWPQVASLLAPEDFYRDSHRMLFAAISTLAERGQPHDPVMVCQALERAGQLETCGGLGRIGSLARNTPSAQNVEGYAAVVRERAALRALAALTQRFERELSEPGEHSVAEIIAQHQAALATLQTRSRTGGGLVASADLAGQLIDDLDRRREAALGLSVGLSDFDELTGGLEPGDLVVAAGRPGMGKTALLVSIAAHVSRTTPTAVFSAEMPASQLMRRAVALGAGVPQGRLRRAEQLTQADWQAMGPALTDLGERRLWIDDTSLPTLQHIRAEAMTLKARHGLGLVMVDYLQLVRGQGKNRYEELREVAYGLKALAKDLNIPVIALAQLNRGVEQRDQKRPYLSDLRDSGAIEEAADIVGLLYSEGYYDSAFGMPYVLECAVEKNRNGERGECLWRFDGAHSRVTVLDPGARAQYRHLRAKQQRRGASDDL